MVKQGICNDYYPNRKLKKVAEYDYGNEVGTVTRYYTDEKVYCVTKHNAVVFRLKYVECHDSTGKVIAKNGKGYWIKLNDDLKLEAEGPVEDSLETGNWHGVMTILRNTNVYIQKEQQYPALATIKQAMPIRSPKCGLSLYLNMAIMILLII